MIVELFQISQWKNLFAEIQSEKTTRFRFMGREKKKGWKFPCAFTQDVRLNYPR